MVSDGMGSRRSERGLQHPDPREDGECDGRRQDEEHEREHHEDLLPPRRFEQLALREIPGVPCLRAKHLDDRRAPVERRDEMVEAALEREVPELAAEIGVTNAALALRLVGAAP